MSKTLPLILLFSTTALCLYGQGTVLFANFDAGTGLDAPVFVADGVTALSGPTYTAALLAGANDNTLQLIATTPFLSGAQSGYFNGGVQSIPGIEGGSMARIQIRVWNSSLFASFAVAQAVNLPNAWGQFQDFSVVTATPPTSPAVLTPLATFYLQQLDYFPPLIHQSYNPIKAESAVDLALCRGTP